MGELANQRRREREAEKHFKEVGERLKRGEDVDPGEIFSPKQTTVLGFDSTTKAFEDKQINDFFWAYMKDYPDWFTAFSSLGVSLVEAQKLIQKKEYRAATALAKRITHAKLKSKFYKEAACDYGKTGMETVKTLVKMFDDDVNKNKEPEIKPEEKTDDLPSYLRNDIDSPEGDRMENETGGLDSQG